MNKKQNNYWLVLDNYVHIVLKGDSLLCYNTLTGGILEYNRKSREDIDPIITLIKRLHSAKNQGAVRLTSRQISDPVIAPFVNQMREAFMADVMGTSLSKGKPVQMLPYLKVHKDVEKIKKFSTRSVGEEMMKYLAEVSIYINNVCALDCDVCASAYRQFLCCTRTSNKKDNMDISSLTKLMEQLKGLPQIRLNILGGDIFKYPHLEALLNLLREQPPSFKHVFYSHYVNLPQEQDIYRLFPPASALKILITFPVLDQKEEHWLQALATARHCQALDIDTQFLFVIAQETHFSQAEELIETHALENYMFLPFYNRRNETFFRENVFLDKEDILEARPGMRDIIARQMVNPLHFGTLTVLSDRRIYANVNAPPLGSLEKNPISDAVYKEMYRGKSWRRIRKKVEPCKHCVFEALCPPLSNYEYALKKNNLCFKDQP